MAIDSFVFPVPVAIASSIPRPLAPDSSPLSTFFNRLAFDTALRGKANSIGFDS